MGTHLQSLKSNLQVPKMSLVSDKSFVVNQDTFQHILRIQNTNIDGNIKIGHALTSIRGMGRRFTDLTLKKAEIDQSKRAGQINEAELERISTVMANPKNFKIPVWFLNRQRDIKDSKLTSNSLDNKLREDLERMKKIRIHRGIRHHWGLRVKGQKTKTTGRHGRAVGVLAKKK